MWARTLNDLSLERIEFDRGAADATISGQVLIAEGGVPLHVSYRVEVGDRWVTRSVAISRRLGGTQRSVSLEHDGEGRWRMDGRHVPALDGCLDVDLEITPSTNALPINRLALPVGGTCSILVALVRFPDLTVVATNQSYERLGTHLYRYRTLESGFAAIMDVDDDGLPIDYENIWRRVAASSSS